MYVKQASSFVRFIYPFTVEQTLFAPLTEGFKSAVIHGKKKTFKVWNQQSFPDEELLSHVAEFLNPPDDKSPTVMLFHIDNTTLSTPDGFGTSADWELITPHRRVPIQISSISLAIFQIGVGFLTLEVKPGNSSDQTEDWFDLIHYFRFTQGQRKVSLAATRRTGFSKETRQPIVSPYFPDIAGGLARHPDGEGTLDQIIQSVLNTAMEAEEDHTWWQDVFIPGQLLPYSVLFINEIEEQDIQPVFYRTRNFFHARQDIHPSEDDLNLTNATTSLYTKDQWFFFSLDGGGFLGCNPPQKEFFDSTLPDHLGTHYFLLFLMALQQRFALTNLSNRVARKWLTLNLDEARIEEQEKRERAFDQIRDQFLFFTARGYFSQMMQREHHHRVYQILQEEFQIERLYQEVSDEVRYMHGILSENREKRSQEQAGRFEWWLNFIVFVIGMPGLALTFVSTIGPVSFLVASLTFVGSTLLGLIVFYVFNRLTKRSLRGKSL